MGVTAFNEDADTRNRVKALEHEVKELTEQVQALIKANALLHERVETFHQPAGIISARGYRLTVA